MHTRIVLPPTPSVALLALLCSSLLPAFAAVFVFVATFAFAGFVAFAVLFDLSRLSVLPVPPFSPRLCCLPLFPDLPFWLLPVFVCFLLLRGFRQFCFFLALD